MISMTPKSVAYFTRFKTFDGTGGGGMRRSHQIRKLFESRYPINIFSSYTPEMDGRMQRDVQKSLLSRGFKNLSANREIKRWNIRQQKHLLHLRNVSSIWIKGLKKLQPMDMAVVEDPIYFAPLVKKLNNSGIPVIASCQNLETLADPLNQLENQLELLLNERNILKMCRLIITISREDAWFLNNFNLPAVYFPYTPPPSVRSRLLGIRRKRENNRKEHFIMLGNAGNIATRNGMKAFIQNWGNNSGLKSFGDLHIAGFNTETLKEEMANLRNLKCLGSLTEDQLDGILISAKGCLCHQEKGSGALTRINEMLTAGIPVVAHSHAARSYHNMTGLFEYSDLSRLETSLGEAEFFASRKREIPIPGEPYTDLMISRIEELLSN